MQGRNGDRIAADGTIGIFVTFFLGGFVQQQRADKLESPNSECSTDLPEKGVAMYGRQHVQEPNLGKVGWMAVGSQLVVSW